MKKYIFISLFILVGAVPYFGSVDKVHTQTFYLSVLSFFSILDIVSTYKKDTLKRIQSLLSNIPILLLVLFFAWSSFTSIYAINFGESIKQLNEILVLILSLVILTHYISLIKVKDRNKLLLFSIVGLCLIELVSVLTPYFRYIITFGFPETRSLLYRGISGNVNVMAYSLLFKLPFLYYFSVRFKKSSWFFGVIVTLILFSVSTILETRSAVLTAIFLSICFFMFYFFENKEITKKNSLKAFRVVMLPLVCSFLLSTLASNVFDKRTVTDRISTLAKLENDTSLGQRFRYFAAAFKTIKEKPLKGVGIGNWEIASIPFEKNYMKSYIVPYHVHNDYLETAAETGLPGLILYYGFIFSILFLLIKNIFFNSKNKVDKHLYFILLMSFTSYLIDALFNFPFARMMSQMNLIFLAAISINILDIKLKKSTPLISLLPFLLILLVPLSVYSSARIYKSSTQQAILFTQFNLNDFTTPSLEIIDKYDMDFLTVSATTIPLLTYKGIYYAERGKYRDAIKFFRKSMEYNPYLNISESFLGYAYYKIEELDSARKYTEQAFYNLPNNLLHYANYLQVLTVLKDSAAVKKVYKNIPIMEDAHDELYLLSLSDIVQPGANREIFKDLDLDFTAANDQLKRGYYGVKIGSKSMYEADYFYLLGVELFEQKEFESALINFQKAAKINPFELPYKENVANTLMQLKRDDEALLILNELIEIDKTESEQAYYLRALVLYGKGERRSACQDFYRLYQLEYLGENALYTTLCNLEAIKQSE